MKLYTQTVCPKCMLVKNIIEMEGKLNLVEVINLDENPEKREMLKSKGYSSLPILEINNTFYLDQKEIIEVINS